MREEAWYRRAAFTISVAGGAVALYLLCRYAVGLFLPFMLAFLLAALTHPMAKRFSARTGLPQKAVAAVFTLSVLALLFVLIYFFCSRLLSELQNLVAYLVEDSTNPDGEFSRLVAFVHKYVNRILPESLRNMAWLESFVGEPEQFFFEQVRGWLLRLSERVPALVFSLLRAFPDILLFFLVSIIASFYISVEYETVSASLVGLLPSEKRKKLPMIKQRVTGALRRYLRAYFLLFLITLGELLLGFLLLRQKYALLLSLLIALLDILPVLGVGTVLLPWSLFLLFTGSAAKGTGLLVLYGVITVVRQIAEPHLVGKSLGMHPVLVLIAFYVGLRLFGIAGIFIGPALMLTLKAFLPRREEKE
ncbi:MAG: sporulation integral membrane protein YtvI [Ruminococcaceae bacterium]|nr:sporulation integral membrane protein YtvI [Oscillospiraceae bacterium]